MGLKPGMAVMDIGCGIGGPLRNIAKFANVKIVGLNNNEYQVTRGRRIAQDSKMGDLASFVKVSLEGEWESIQSSRRIAIEWNKKFSKEFLLSSNRQMHLFMHCLFEDRRWCWINLSHIIVRNSTQGKKY
jgi:SAM-dependent methyltransferase